MCGFKLVCLGMSEKTQLLFWPRIGEARQLEESNRFEDSGPESESQPLQTQEPSGKKNPFQ